jgi:hypothetical protein
MGGADVQIQSLLISASDIGTWSDSGSDRFSPGERLLCPLESGLGETKRWCERFMEDKIVSPLPGTKLRTVQSLYKPYLGRPSTSEAI